MGPRSSSKNRQGKSLLCMNSNPDESKWGYVAPAGGCTEIVENVDVNTIKALCWKCTMRITSSNINNPKDVIN